MFDVKVGQEVGYGKFHWESLVYAGSSRVAKINGHGHIILENGKVFDKAGRDRTIHSSAYLIEIDVYRHHFADRKALQVRRQIVDNIFELLKDKGQWAITDEVRAQLHDKISRL